MTAPTVDLDTLSPQTVEPGTRAWLYCKGYDSNYARWIKTGTWVQTGGDPVALTAITNAGGTIVWWLAPKAPTTKQYSFQITVVAASGEKANGSVTITVPPWQTGGA